MKYINLVLIVLVVGCLTVISCSKDDESPTEPGNYDPEQFCDERLCANNAELKQKCINAFNLCVANNPDLNDEECAGSALIYCRDMF